MARARDIQLQRYAALGFKNVRTNAQAAGPVLEEVARAVGAGLSLLRDAADAMQLSARGYHRVLRVARTRRSLRRRLNRLFTTPAIPPRSAAAKK